jgi:autotransporter-associated beta strand protein
MKRFLVIAFTLVVQTWIARAATIVMNGNDAAGTASFNSGANWTGGAAPAAGNTYQTAAFLLRTPANSTSIAFAGNSLEIQNGGNLRDKTTAATVTIGSLILDGGSIFDMSGNGGTLAGNLTLNGGTAFISVGGGQSFTCSSVISGSGGFITYNPVSSGIGTDILTSANTFTGGIIVTNAVLQANSIGSSSTPLGGVANNTSSTAAANVTVNTGGTLVGGGADSFGYYPNVAPATIFINGGTITDLGTSNYRVTLPNLTFTGGTLTSAAGNTGDANGNYSFFGAAGTCTVTTLSNNTTAIINPAKISAQSPTIFNVAAGNVTTGLTPGVDLLVSSQLIPFGVQPITKIGAGLMALTGTNTISGVITINGGTLQLGTTSDTTALTSLLGTGLVTNNATLRFASSQSITVSNVINGTGNLMVSNGAGILFAANTYSGSTTVAKGTLLVNNLSGSGTGSGNVAVNNGGIFGGNGSVSGNVTVNGKTRPGIIAATNTIGGNVTYNFGAEADFYLTNSGTGGGNGQIILNGAAGILDCGSASVGIFLTGAFLDQSSDYTLFNLTGGSASIAGNFIATPVWLGTTPANASSYSIATMGNKVVLHYTSSSTTNPPVVANVAASNISFTSATLNGQLISSGSQYPAVTIYYGTSDGGTNPANWMASVPLGLQNGSFAAMVSNLTANTTYYFTAMATNSAGAAWATPSKSFITLTLVAATVTNLPASNIQGSSAILNGQILSIGNQTPTVTLYYGPTDGGTNAAVWANNIYIGQQSGAFTITVTGLSTNTIYYYAAAALNNAGTAWATPSLTFTTLPTAPVVSVLTYHNDNARAGVNTNELY